MLNKIKNKILHILRKLCGYYELEVDAKSFKHAYLNMSNDFSLEHDENKKLKQEYTDLMTKYVSMSINYTDLVAVATNYKFNICESIPENKYVIRVYEDEKKKDQYKFLALELDSILDIMTNKGTHPRDLLKRAINEAQRKSKQEHNDNDSK